MHALSVELCKILGYIKIGKRIVLSLMVLFSLCDNIMSNEEKKSTLSLSLELSSKYMWRGMEYGTSPTIHPMISFNKAGFNVFCMGAYAFNGSHQEVDLGASYTYKGMTLGIADYYYPSVVGEIDSYFDFNKMTTKHSIEAYFTLFPFKFPLWFTISTYVFGNDKRLDGKQAYSSYVETGYRHYFNSKNILAIAAGANLNKSFYTGYESGFNIVNITLKYTHNLLIKKFTLPLSVSYIINPYKKKPYFTFSAFINI